MAEGEVTWNDRKQRVREAYYQELVPPTDPPLTTPVPPGSARSLVARMVGAFAKAEPSPEPGTTATSATATARPATPIDPPSSSTLAASTSPSSAASMAWTVSPLGFVERNLKASIVDPSGSLHPGLPPKVQSSLAALATGRNEPVDAVVQQIVEWYIEEEDDRIETMTLGELVTWHMETQFV